MRTTVDIHDELLTRAKAAAAAQQRRLSDLVNDALFEILERDTREPDRREPYRVRTFGAGGPLPGVDFSDNGSLQDVMDEEAHDLSTGEIDFSKLR